MVQLDLLDAKPIYEQVKDCIRHLVISGALVSDEKLPSVREMAAKLAINPNTIAKAYRELEEEGYIYSKSGKGTFVSPNKEVQEQRTKDLLKEFDAVVEKLIYLSIPPQELVARVKGMGGEEQPL